MWSGWPPPTSEYTATQCQMPRTSTPRLDTWTTWHGVLLGCTLLDKILLTWQKQPHTSQRQLPTAQLQPPWCLIGTMSFLGQPC